MEEAKYNKVIMRREDDESFFLFFKLKKSSSVHEIDELILEAFERAERNVSNMISKGTIPDNRDEQWCFERIFRIAMVRYSTIEKTSSKEICELEEMPDTLTLYY